MAEPENHTIHILREIRAAIQGLEDKVEGLDGKLERGHQELRSRMDNIRQALNGESVLGRYAAAEVEERLDSIEKRLEALRWKTRNRCNSLQLSTTFAVDCGSSALNERW